MVMCGYSSLECVQQQQPDSQQDYCIKVYIIYLVLRLKKRLKSISDVWQE